MGPEYGPTLIKTVQGFKLVGPASGTCIGQSQLTDSQLPLAHI